jgi:hypothetical protein
MEQQNMFRPLWLFQATLSALAPTLVVRPYITFPGLPIVRALFLTGIPLSIHNRGESEASAHHAALKPL